MRRLSSLVPSLDLRSRMDWPHRRLGDLRAAAADVQAHLRTRWILRIVASRRSSKVAPGKVLLRRCYVRRWGLLKTSANRCETKPQVRDIFLLQADPRPHGWKRSTPSSKAPQKSSVWSSPSRSHGWASAAGPVLRWSSLRGVLSSCSAMCWVVPEGDGCWRQLMLSECTTWAAGSGISCFVDVEHVWVLRRILRRGTRRRTVTASFMSCCRTGLRWFIHRLLGISAGLSCGWRRWSVWWRTLAGRRRRHLERRWG